MAVIRGSVILEGTKGRSGVAGEGGRSGRGEVRLRGEEQNGPARHSPSTAPKPAPYPLVPTPPGSRHLAPEKVQGSTVPAIPVAAAVVVVVVVVVWETAGEWGVGELSAVVVCWSEVCKGE
ncbi:hypothetical protein E2C01_075309 [Portunus trituberculatus]|uniref:Uncharacterized protein n=1 Tax=Portunus trituberculatus TaxID=210409 RepID=A0A5B7I5S7_PORTR|nr:hypothetical protein [Portunus trituberculatus]